MELQMPTYNLVFGSSVITQIQAILCRPMAELIHQRGRYEAGQLLKDRSMMMTLPRHRKLYWPPQHDIVQAAAGLARYTREDWRTITYYTSEQWTLSAPRKRQVFRFMTDRG